MQDRITSIIKRIVDGDNQAFREVVESYQQQAFSLTFRILGDEEEAKDAVQEGFIKVWQSLKSYRSDYSFTSWMCRIMAHAAIDRLRKIRRQKEIQLDPDPERMNTLFRGNPDVTMENKEIAHIIRILADGLPVKQRLVFLLRDIQGLKSVEVQAILGLSETRIKSNLYHARKSVREKIDRIDYPERRQW
ncbi:MAG: RNA polymerase sigma factor [Bacteroidales bacterium]|nr:RNA polymerase sigma factor [Bacteroidales bacterium]